MPMHVFSFYFSATTRYPVSILSQPHSLRGASMAVQSPGKALLSAQNIVLSYGSQPVLRDISLTIHEGDRIGLIGQNGSGKSSLLKVLSGAIIPDSGFVTRSEGLRIAMLAQDNLLDRTMTVGQALQEGTAELRAMLDAYHAAVERLAVIPGSCWEHREAQEECDALHHLLEMHGAWQMDQEIKRIAVALNLPSSDRILSTLSGGELRRVDLAAKLIQRPDVLLLDEPTNHIDTRSVEWMEAFLEQYPGSCVLVTHDRYFLDRIVNRIVEIEAAKLLSFPGRYDRFLEYKAVREDTLVRTEANRRALVRRELAWYRRGAKARTTKQKARIHRFERLLENVPPPRRREFFFEIPQTAPLGKTILEARRIAHGFENRTLFKDFSLIMQQHMRIGIIGPNGCGKTTLLRVLMGLEEPRRGKIIIGEATTFLYIDQAHEKLNPDQSVLQFISDGAKTIEINRRKIFVPAYLERFLFDKATADTPIGKLSGGEKNRLYIIKQLLQGGNFLVLDEPTNDLDLYSLRVLEETIEAFHGCALIVSHDRYFLNRICTHMLVFEDDGHIKTIVGNYDDYLLYKGRCAAETPQQQAASRMETNNRDVVEKPRRLTWKEKREYETIEDAILQAEARVAELETLIQEPGFYERGHENVRQTLAELDRARDAVNHAYARWQALEAIARGDE